MKEGSGGETLCSIPHWLINNARTDPLKKDMDPTEKLFNYISFLEETNHQLVGTLKQCHTLLRQFIDQVPDPIGWQMMLKDLQGAIKAGERGVGKKEVQ